MKNVIKKINETGTLLIEALAMLGLVSMVTPVLYKKAAERTAELQDINASSQLRAIASAMDAYLTDNFAKIVQRQNLSTNQGNNNADFSQFNTQLTETSAIIDISALKDYLPYGMMSGDNIRSTKLISNSMNRSNPDYDENIEGSQQYISKPNYKIVVKLNQQFEGPDPVVQTLTGFIIAEPRQGIVNSTRAARIASMIGSNGGYITGDNVNGVQGVWSVNKDDLDDEMKDNTIVISSLQPISSQGLSNEKVLYRVDMPNDGNDQQLNTMTTDLFMGRDANSTRNIRMVNQIVMMPDAARMVGSAGATSHQSPDAINEANLDNALYIGNNGGAYISGTLQAMQERFQVKNGAINYFGTRTIDDGSGGQIVQNNANSTFHVGMDNMSYGNPGGLMKLVASDNGMLLYNQQNPSYMYLAALPQALTAMNNTLYVYKNGDTDGYVTIGTGGSITAQQSANLTPYTWDTNHVATAGTAADGNAVLTVGGSAFVENTLLGGKVKGFDVEASRLRAGITRNSFNAADDDDDFFMKVLSDETPGVEDTANPANNIPAIAAHNRFILGNEDTPFVRAADTVRPGFTVDAQRVNGGIDLLAGETALLDANNNVTNDTPQAGKIRLGAENGIFLSTYNAGGTGLNVDSAVSIQSDTLQVYQKANGNRTIDAVTRRFYVINNNNIVNLANTENDADGTIAAANNTKTNEANEGKYIVEGMEFNVGRREFGNNGTIILTEDDSLNLDNDDEDNYNNNIRETSILNIQPSRYGNSKVTTRLRGGVGFYDHDQLGENRDNPADTNNPAALYINKNTLEIRATTNDPSPDTVNGEERYAVNKGDLILAVDNNHTYSYDDDANYGSVYIRKGSINLGTNRGNRLTNTQILQDYAISTTQTDGTPNPTRKQNMTGYIAADRFISNYSLKGSEEDINAIKATSDRAVAESMHTYGTGEKYNKYELNPAYTSVMHDIKLTTRGGARLSDILPDFINKGIYVVDTSYSESSVGNWAGTNTHPTFDADTCKSGCEAVANEPVSAYVGFVPTPKCPPGYAKVITLTPAGWAMAQAGKLGITNNRAKIDIYDAAVVLNTNSQSSTGSSGGDDDGDGDGNGSVDENAPQPIYLDYQKSTWLRSEVRPVYGGEMNTTGDAKKFNGWGLIMGFIYPSTQYKSLVDATTATTTTQTLGIHHGAHGTSNFTSPTGTTTETVYWNLFPVYKSELEGYATVYCYFDRNKDFYDSDYVEKYNQLDKFTTCTGNGCAKKINSYEKGENNGTGTNGLNVYQERLNDQRLKYKDPW